ncbi:brevican core protein triforce isoform X2 [Musca autumnalis]|uniref:brevican core protein triforce isoform X2 n=1 Tax=Musca autumnalis TaxID=221902 RepID=UPI003CE7E6A6
MKPFTVILLIAITLANGSGHISRTGQIMSNININDINNIAATGDSDSVSSSSSSSVNSASSTPSNSVSNSYTKNTFNNDSVNTFIVTPMSVAPTSPSSSSSSTAATTTAPTSSKSSTSSSSASALQSKVSLSDLPITISNTSSTLRDKRDTNFGLDPSEIARQNQITQQLLSTYLQTRLGLGVGVTQKVPTIAEILPKAILTPTTTTTTTTPKPRYTKSLKRPRPRGFSVSSSSYKNGGSTKTNNQRKTYGSGSSSSQRKSANSLQELLKYRNYQRKKAEEQQEQPEDDYEDEVEAEPEEEAELDAEADYDSNEGEPEPEEEDLSNNKTLKFKRPSQQKRRQPTDDDELDDYEEYRSRPRYRSHQQQRYRSAYPPFHRHYDDDIDQDGQEALQSVESEQHDHYYKTKGDIFARDPSENEIDSDCPHCVDDTQYMNKWTMPLLKLGEKRYYLGIFFKANWFKATQYCRYHGMHLASISSQEENDRLEKHIKDFGLDGEHFWISGTDLADEGSFFWMATGRPITFTNWNAGEPNNYRYENGEEENCMELWNRDGKGLKWNDSPCSFETYFICEVSP